LWGLGIGDIENDHVISERRTKVLEVITEESHDYTIECCSKSSVALLYKITSKERRKENPPMPNTMALYTVCLPSTNQNSNINVLSEG